VTVVDTNVLADALLGVSGVRERAFQLLQEADEVVVPDLFFAELANVVWQYVTRMGLPLARGLEILDDAEALVTRSVPATTLWHRAVELAVEGRHPVYDTLFVALAEAEGTKLVTRDARLRDRFPDLVLGLS
jgi:predicted nucleic acid-binding protein